MPAFSDTDNTVDTFAGWDAMLEGGAKAPSLAAHIAWATGALLLLVLLGAQFGLFEGPRWIQNERVRPWLETACQNLGCDLPTFRSPKRIDIVDHALQPAPNGIGGCEFTLILSNQASLPQAFPAIKLILSGNDGKPAAARVFQPGEYLPEHHPELMPVGKPQEVRVLLANPQHEVTGFYFELL